MSVEFGILGPLELLVDGGPVGLGGAKQRISMMTKDAHVTMDGKDVALGKGVTTTGRMPDRDLIVLDPGASRVHAEIRLTTDGYRLIDADLP